MGAVNNPHPKFQAQVEAFLKKYPTLLRDPSYVEFLRTYGGASLSFPEEGDEQWQSTLATASPAV